PTSGRATSSAIGPTTCRAGSTYQAEADGSATAEPSPSSPPILCRPPDPRGASEPPGEAAVPRRPQCQGRQSQILPAATPASDHPAQQQVDKVGVLRERRRRAPEPVPQQVENGAVGRAEIFRRRVLQLP